MDTAIILGIFELIYSVFIVIIALWLSFKLLLRMTKEIDEINLLKNRNVAVGIFISSVISGIGIILYKTIYPVICTFNTFIIKSEPEVISFLSLLGLILIYVLIAIFIGFFTIWLSMKLFCKLTKNIDEFSEIKKGNVAVAIIFATTIIIISFFIADGLAAFLSGLIPSPSIGQFQIF